MTSRTAVFEEAGPTGSLSQDLSPSGLGPMPLLLLSAWCGLTAGLLEVGATILRKRTFDLNHLYWMTRHFVWLIPLLNLAIFLVLGVVLVILVWSWRRRGRWLANRLLGALTLLPAVWAAFPRIYGPAGFLLALGLAALFAFGTSDSAVATVARWVMVSAGLWWAGFTLLPLMKATTFRSVSRSTATLKSVSIVS